MSRIIGLWIDHAHARMVELGDEGQAGLATIASNIEGHHRTTGGRGTTLPGRLGGNPGTKRDRHREQELRRYYNTIISLVSRADRLVVMGPGRAKQEFMKELEHYPAVRNRVAGVEATDKLTANQIAAHARHMLRAVPGREKNA